MTLDGSAVPKDGMDVVWIREVSGPKKRHKRNSAM